jgi:hypothetical protein
MTTKIDKMGGSHPDDEEGQDPIVVASSSAVDGHDDMLSLGRVDQALATKMHLVNDVSFAETKSHRQIHVDDIGD